jgi:hypothetical protein
MFPGHAHEKCALLSIRPEEVSMRLFRASLPWLVILVFGILLPLRASAHPSDEPHFEFGSFTTGLTAFVVWGAIGLLLGGGVYYWLQRRALINNGTTKKDNRLE